MSFLLVLVFFLSLIFSSRWSKGFLPLWLRIFEIRAYGTPRCSFRRVKPYSLFWVFLASFHSFGDARARSTNRLICAGVLCSLFLFSLAPLPFNQANTCIFISPLSLISSLIRASQRFKPAKSIDWGAPRFYGTAFDFIVISIPP